MKYIGAIALLYLFWEMGVLPKVLQSFFALEGGDRIKSGIQMVADEVSTLAGGDEVPVTTVSAPQQPVTQPETCDEVRRSLQRTAEYFGGGIEVSTISCEGQ